MSQLEASLGDPLSQTQLLAIERALVAAYVLGVEDGWEGPFDGLTPLDEDRLEGVVPIDAVRPTKRPGR